MNELAKESLTVEVVGKFGVLAKDVWYSLNEPLKLTDFEKGGVYDVEVSTSKTGKKYIKTSVKSGSVPVVEKKAFVPSKPAYQPRPPFAKKADSGLSKEEWAAKDRSQMIGGLSHDAVELVKAHVQSLKPMSVLLALYKEALDGAIKMRDEMK